VQRASELPKLGPFVGGAFASGPTTPVASPWDGAAAGEAGAADEALLERAIELALAAQPAVAGLSRDARAGILERAAATVAAESERLARTITGETGKPIRFARIEAARCADTLRASAHAARELGGEEIPLDAAGPGAGRLGFVRRFPVGPVLGIAPWNFPLNLVAHKMGPALAAGCALVLKPATKTPLSALLLAEILHESGMPTGGLAVVPTSRALGQRLVEDDRFRALSFTGSAEVGWQMKRDAGKKRVILELGGNAAAIVLPDADLAHAAARCAFGAFYQAGQSCISVQRVIAHASIAERFRELLAAESRAIVFGDPWRDETVCGPVIDRPSAERLTGWIAEARAAGAEALAGGDTKGTLVPPTLLSGAPKGARVVADEAFGPIACLEVAASTDDAIARAADTRFGLQCGLFTNDWRAIRAAWERIEVGAVVVGDAPAFRVDLMPYGGSKDSGFGREGPRYAMREMTEERIVTITVS